MGHCETNGQMKCRSQFIKPVKPQKVPALIAAQIRTAILAGEFAPEERLPPERELAEAFGVSRPSVRKALHDLAMAGLIKSCQGGGALVRSLVESTMGESLAEMLKSDRLHVSDVIEVRKGLESWAAYYAAQRALPEDLLKMTAAIDGLKNGAGNGTPAELLDAEFHLLVAKASHNLVWLHTMQIASNAMKEFRLAVCRTLYQTGGSELLYAHHQRIFTSIMDRDTDGAREAMLEHMAYTEHRSSAFWRTPVE